MHQSGRWPTYQSLSRSKPPNDHERDLCREKDFDKSNPVSTRAAQAHKGLASWARSVGTIMKSLAFIDLKLFNFKLLSQTFQILKECSSQPHTRWAGSLNISDVLLHTQWISLIPSSLVLLYIPSSMYCKKVTKIQCKKKKWTQRGIEKTKERSKGR